MSEKINLRDIERKAFRSTFEDGLWDIYLGLIVIAMSVFMARPETGYGPGNILIMLASFCVAYLLFWAGKKFVTVPRMGQVTFGQIRKKKKTTLAVILAIVILLQAGFVVLSNSGWMNDKFSAWLSQLLGGSSMERIMVASIGSLFIGPSMILIAYFLDFDRGYYIAIMMGLAVFLMILINRAIYPILIGSLIVVPGVVLFLRFLRKYPLSNDGEEHV